MVTVSTKEFKTNQDKYFDMAINEAVCIKNGDDIFHLIYENQYPEQPILEPDDDFYRSISTKEFREKLVVVLDRVDKKYAK